MSAFTEMSFDFEKKNFRGELSHHFADLDAQWMRLVNVEGREERQEQNEGEHQVGELVPIMSTAGGNDFGESKNTAEAEEETPESALHQQTQDEHFVPQFAAGDDEKSWLNDVFLDLDQQQQHKQICPGVEPLPHLIIDPSGEDFDNWGTDVGTTPATARPAVEATIDPALLQRRPEQVKSGDLNCPDTQAQAQQLVALAQEPLPEQRVTQPTSPEFAPAQPRTVHGQIEQELEHTLTPLALAAQQVQPLTYEALGEEGFGRQLQLHSAAAQTAVPQRPVAPMGPPLEQLLRRQATQPQNRQGPTLSSTPARSDAQADAQPRNTRKRAHDAANRQEWERKPAGFQAVSRGGRAVLRPKRAARPRKDAGDYAQGDAKAAQKHQNLSHKHKIEEIKTAEDERWVKINKEACDRLKEAGYDVGKEEEEYKPVPYAKRVQPQRPVEGLLDPKALKTRANTQSKWVSQDGKREGRFLAWQTARHWAGLAQIAGPEYGPKTQGVLREDWKRSLAAQGLPEDDIRYGLAP